MADIPVIPGVSISPKGILNRPIKDIICAILFGGINNLLKGNLLCVKADLDALITNNTNLPGLADIKQELKNVRDQIHALEDISGIKDTIGRVNQAIAEVQSLLALDGLCKIPLKAPAIPDIIKQVTDAELNEANAILNDLGRLSKPQLCIDGAGGLNTGSYNPDSILGSIQKHLNRMGDIPSQQINVMKNRLKGIENALRKSINRQLFPDFRHKTDLTTGSAYVAGSSAITLAAPPPLANQWNPPYPPQDIPNLKDATSVAQALVSNVGKTASYPASVNGIRHENIWPGLVGPTVYSLAVNALTPQDPFYAQQEPVYDYCGKLVGYTSTVITGDQAAAGKDPIVDAELNPPKTNFEFLWIAERNCWAVTGVQSEQIVNGYKGTYLDANPTITLHRSYNHIFSIPSYDSLGATIAPEFYIYKVNPDLTPNINAKFNLGLSRLETYELLEDANGLDEPEATVRKQNNPLGTTLYFAADAKVYAGTTPPDYPSELVWWDNLVTCQTYKWVLNRDGDGEPTGTGTWVEVTDQERADKWVGSSNTYGDPHTDYLCYSNRDGTVYGLLKLV